MKLKEDTLDIIYTILIEDGGLIGDNGVLDMEDAYEILDAIAVILECKIEDLNGRD